MVLNQQTHSAPSPRVTTKRTNIPISTAKFPEISRRSQRQHQPEIISQEEGAYQLLETPLPSIKTAYAVTDQLMGQKLEYMHLL
jgi:hypothetical protein